jgi:NAD-dependent protein deacetylases, SIR2 family
VDEKIVKLNSLISRAENIVFFGGAGVSTESGIPDFRSADGLYSQKFKYPPEEMLSHSFFVSHTEEFYDFYREKMLPSENIKPNAAHIKLAELEKIGKLSAVITQNIDGLHQAAGSKNVLELHGSVWRNHCMKCGKYYGTDRNSKGAPYCSCGGIIKPDVVLYEENLNSEILEISINQILAADLLIIGGSSMSVYPAAGLVRYFRGNALVIINKSPTQYDSSADLVINDSIGKVFERISL